MTVGAPTRRTLWADAVAEWLPVTDGYWHAQCGVPVEFHWFTADPYLRPLLAICPGCGKTWEREKARQAWQPAAAGGVRLRVIEPEEPAGQEPERRAA